jgi:hypothetical protein
VASGYKGREGQLTTKEASVKYCGAHGVLLMLISIMACSGWVPRGDDDRLLTNPSRVSIVAAHCSSAPRRSEGTPRGSHGGCVGHFMKGEFTLHNPNFETMHWHALVQHRHSKNGRLGESEIASLTKPREHEHEVRVRAKAYDLSCHAGT